MREGKKAHTKVTEKAAVKDMVVDLGLHGSEQAQAYLESARGALSYIKSLVLPHTIRRSNESRGPDGEPIQPATPWLSVPVPVRLWDTEADRIHELADAVTTL